MQPPLHPGRTRELLPNSKWHSWPVIVRSRVPWPIDTTKPLAFIKSLSLQSGDQFHLRPLPPILLRQRLVQFPLVKVLFFWIERSRINHPYLFSISPIHTKHSNPAHRPTQVEKPCLDRKSG